MSTPSQPLCIGIIDINIQINSDLTFKIDNSHSDSWIILWHNQHNIFLYLPNHQNTIGSLPGTLSNRLIPFLGALKAFMHCGPGGAWIENGQLNPTQALFVERLFTQTLPASNLTPPSYPALFSFTSKQKLIQLPSGSDLPMIKTPLLPHQKTRRAFLWDQDVPNGQSVCTLWGTSPPGSTFNARNIITNKVVSCHNHGNSPPWIFIWHIKPQSFYGQLAIYITSVQYAHVYILWTIYGHLSFGAFMALHLNPEAIAAIYSQMGISGHFPQNQGKWPKWLFLAICAYLCIFAHFDAKCPKDTFPPFGPVFGSEPKSGQKPQRTQKYLFKL
ncbi:hypothetical protein O181_048456 [Austropuccinia psidii MF-1]|uniref:Uncharacterized protein n=1 Tax=Austropuccinia psidii MF-1 TaxID=1389203 RepID=A0A9Q3DQS0_9BASI|nr:hypothetical protein [Austropuccinia psidii MF-1]